MLLCLHEEHAVAIAQGWAKVTGTPMLAAVHSNVGLFHATMAIFNAWCDRMPVIVLGATGPLDAAKRRPWIEWIHTAPGPGRHRAPLREVGRAAGLAGGRARGAVPGRLAGAHGADGPGLREPGRRDAGGATGRAAAAARPGAPDAARDAGRPDRLVARGARSCCGSRAAGDPDGPGRRAPSGMGRAGASGRGLGARVVTDLKVGAAFPTDHPLHAGSPGVFPVPAAARPSPRPT